MKISVANANVEPKRLPHTPALQALFVMPNLREVDPSSGFQCMIISNDHNDFFLMAGIRLTVKDNPSDTAMLEARANQSTE
jgi:hypothetical protein